jgi:hypothetical protein
MALKTYESNKNTRYDTALALKTLPSLIKHTQWNRAGFETARQPKKTHSMVQSRIQNNTRYGTEPALKTHSSLKNMLWYRSDFENPRKLFLA